MKLFLNNKKTLLNFLLTMTFLLSNAHAAKIKLDGGDSGAGGNGISIQFLKTLKKVSGKVKSRPDLYPEFSNINLGELIEEVSNNIVLSEDAPMVLLDNGGYQESTAVSGVKDGKKFITLNGDPKSEYRIDKISDSEIFETLALHELAVLSKVEKTGKYNVSQRYLVNSGVFCAEKICTPNEIQIVYYKINADLKLRTAENILEISNLYISTNIPIAGATSFGVYGRTDMKPVCNYFSHLIPGKFFKASVERYHANSKFPIMNILNMNNWEYFGSYSNEVSYRAAETINCYYSR